VNILQVRELTARIRAALDSPELQNVAVVGEISNFKHHSSGHMYFSLKDETSRIRAVMFRSRNHRLTFIPQGSVPSSIICCSLWLILSLFARSSSKSDWPSTLRRVV